MKNLSLWSSRNPVISRILIGVFSIIIAGNAILLGFLFFADDIKISNTLVNIILFFALLVYVIYPSVNRLNRTVYRKQKRCDIVLVISGFLLLSFWFLNFANGVDGSQQSIGEETILLSAVNTSLITLDSDPNRKVMLKAFKKYKKEIRKSLQNLKKQYKKDGNKEGVKAIRILLYLLTFIGALILAYFVAAWSCSVSCSGNDTAAAFILIGGAALVIYLVIISIKLINKKYA